MIIKILTIFISEFFIRYNNTKKIWIATTKNLVKLGKM